MSAALAGTVPRVGDVARISAMSDPQVRNLEITLAYARLSAAMAARAACGSNWCTFATWASRQAGATIRGEDFLDRLARRLRLPEHGFRPVRRLWRALLRRGVLRPDSTMGRVVARIHSPFDAFERTSQAVARGNLKVFQEIAHEFARYLEEVPPGLPVASPEFERFLASLRPGPPPGGQDRLRQAFTRYQEVGAEPDPARRAQLAALANLEIGFHEQTRLQPEIQESLDAPLVTARDLSVRAIVLLLPGAPLWRLLVRGPIAALLDVPVRRLRAFSAALAREVITETLMVLALPGPLVLSLGRHLDAARPASLASPQLPDLVALLQQVDPCRRGTPDCGADDWASLDQRMHYIAHLFLAMHERADLMTSPFTEVQIAAVQQGRLPDGGL